MKKAYFIWLIIYGVVWVLILIDLIPDLNEWQLVSICIYIIVLFIVPLFSERPNTQCLLFCIQALTSIVIFFPVNGVINPYVLLIQLLIIAETVYYLSRLRSFIVIGVQSGSAAFILMKSDTTVSQLAWFGFFYVLFVVALFYYQSMRANELELRKKNDVLLDEYRKMKRQLLIEEELARQDERMLIGHEIHDSVGHKLTALLMQFEAFRLTAADDHKDKINNLKELAEQSLEETRRAVKSFKQKEVGGLQGVIRLIRKLEMESFMKVNFSVKHGAFLASLTGEQSFAVYRAVQEALTNIMKHSTTREAQVIFETLGGSVFRFEVVNESEPNPFFQEGYGLKAMRERLEKVGGSLAIHHDQYQFVVSGSIRLREKG
ncbi:MULTISPECIES: sensor histidine kinase [Clostridia]|uniref:sensor histidine kinase n=1 Tax=Clostridia TaxID=186801 RepID=UPI000EA34CF1|nr:MULTISPECIES: sensor histidine kinase [Clostridia]NBJ70355.1 sensor histidine kinase [Roseburia sp. 1XD42-34]RKI76352.1 sensor histidine kinase [Clostridium sp. 1xD42-85]